MAPPGCVASVPATMLISPGLETPATDAAAVVILVPSGKMMPSSEDSMSLARTAEVEMTSLVKTKSPLLWSKNRSPLVSSVISARLSADVPLCSWNTASWPVWLWTRRESSTVVPTSWSCFAPWKSFALMRTMVKVRIAKSTKVTVCTAVQKDTSSASASMVHGCVGRGFSSASFMLSEDRKLLSLSTEPMSMALLNLSDRRRMDRGDAA
mmetsp:Transcript_11457/g.34782  ORF Transcript_11457/g.34782 Transcript_11457/m.34782 type:complete len:210 (-) Transcript_11457:512-1141(-)